jgi:hypothetical protein
VQPLTNEPALVRTQNAPERCCQLGSNPDQWNADFAERYATVEGALHTVDRVIGAEAKALYPLSAYGSEISRSQPVSGYHKSASSPLIWVHPGNHRLTRLVCFKRLGEIATPTVTPVASSSGQGFGSFQIKTAISRLPCVEGVTVSFRRSQRKSVSGVEGNVIKKINALTSGTPRRDSQYQAWHD